MAIAVAFPDARRAAGPPLAQFNHEPNNKLTRLFKGQGVRETLRDKRVRGKRPEGVRGDQGWQETHPEAAS
eukprot:1157249-Pelagomonas_calceolata.AAC.4